MIDEFVLFASSGCAGRSQKPELMSPSDRAWHPHLRAHPNPLLSADSPAHTRKSRSDARCRRLRLLVISLRNPDVDSAQRDMHFEGAGVHTRNVGPTSTGVAPIGVAPLISSCHPA